MSPALLRILSPRDRMKISCSASVPLAVLPTLSIANVPTRRPRAENLGFLGDSTRFHLATGILAARSAPGTPRQTAPKARRRLRTRERYGDARRYDLPSSM